MISNCWTFWCQLLLCQRNESYVLRLFVFNPIFVSFAPFLGPRRIVESLFLVWYVQCVYEANTFISCNFVFNYLALFYVSLIAVARVLFSYSPNMMTDMKSWFKNSFKNSIVLDFFRQFLVLITCIRRGLIYSICTIVFLSI